ncbi:MULTISPECIES: ribulose-phosphate 3-epimerase [Leptospira]|uniref:Ribulose-phosphate 3-epimerase n=3 Tax=Leptospira TaxID=171 RepID=A0A5F2C409_9LEPT|nr:MULTISPECIES: ribulose-phosphate 3-epimerase [Leptospira]PJZ49648.1 ribulose-phosphate 3-epimerase [Leptospira saintgironsiae]TGM11170.1 ribulose-phosphate 3-epimerase [Leptospira selangorensis]TGM23077.1 ribulose-phosphate 3-epimerase [Leptospira selangorensis]TGM98890.1 ribulose-phosphate 3-epimerase [Leptospira dzoumogneensis]
MKISASILATQLTALANTVPNFKKEGIDLVHMDVMDGNFVPQISFGEAVNKEIKAMTQIPLDVHLMVEKPENHVPKYYELNPYCITFHAETTRFPIRLAQEIKKNGPKVGVSLNPGTPVSALETLLPYIDLVLIMTVEPGFYGQKFVDGGMDKIRKVKSLISNYPIELEVDGGVNDTNIKELSQAGVDICVVGAGLFKSGDPSENGIRLKGLAK